MTETGRRPSFFIVGAPKCGTSSMAHYLRQHPDVFLSGIKDVPFFGSDLHHTLGGGRESSVEEYLERFADAGGARQIGEACVWYLYSSRAATEIHSFNPAAKIIVMLREPIELLYSLHSHLLFMDDEDIEDFEEALNAEADRKAGRRIPRSTNFVQGLFYRDVVRFSAQLERYFAIFGRSRVHVVLYDDLKADTEGVVREVVRYLGFDREFLFESRIVNPNKSVRNRRLQALLQAPPPRLERAFRRAAPSAFHGRVIPLLQRLNMRYEPRAPLDPGLRDHLRRETRPEIERLERLLARDLSAWKS